MNDTKTGTTTHLAAEARERIGMGGEPEPGESRHPASCERCRREIAEIGSLQERFAALVVLVPLTGFANRVMARVQLPAPRWSRALAGLRTHPPRVAAIAATAVAAVVGTFVWLTTYPQVTPGVMAKLVYERGSGLVWQGVVAVGRVVYDSGLATLDRRVPCGPERLERRWCSGDVDAGRDDLDVDVAEAHGSLAQCDTNRSETNWMIDTVAHAEACATRLDSGPGDGG